MGSVTLQIDGTKVRAGADATLLQAALTAGIYIPHLCHHPDLSAFDTAKPVRTVYRGGVPIHAQNDGAYEGCGLCAVSVAEKDGFLLSCNESVADGMIVTTDSPPLLAHRRQKLAKVLGQHPHACLTCAQAQGCSLTQCSSHVPEHLRCCPSFNRCELRKVSEHVGIAQDVPRYVPCNLPRIADEPLFQKDYNLCIGCTRCVRACTKQHGDPAIGYALGSDGPMLGALGALPSESGCRFCGACVEVCPTGALTDKDMQRASRKQDLLPCKNTCPIELDVPSYLRHIAQGNFADAARVIRAKTPLAATLGRVCFHPCEDRCRRGKVSEPVAVCALKRFAVEAGDPDQTMPDVPPTGKRVAIVGSGPAGLTSAYQLARKGHNVTLFEAKPKPGGMLRYGIPKYRLPEQVLDQEIERILADDRIELRTGSPVRFGSLSDEGFDSVLLAVGTQKGKRLPVDNDNLPSVLQGIDFLEAVARDNIDKVPIAGKRIVVIGGGNVAIDAARTSVRLGAAQVDLVCLESCDKMPAHDLEVTQAQEEGVRFHHSWGVANITTLDGQSVDLELMECCAVFAEDGRFDPRFNEAVTDSLVADRIIAAIGQEPDLEFLDQKAPGRTGGGLLQVDPQTQATTMDGWFAAGDVAGGLMSVVSAIAAGNKAARAIDQFLGGEGDLGDNDYLRATPKQEGCVEGFADRHRAPMPCLDPETRRSGFDAVETGLNETDAIAEAGRCLGCDLRLEYHEFLAPPEKWMEFCASSIDTVPLVEGVFQLLDENKAVTGIVGCANLRKELNERLEEGSNARFFLFEIDPMFTKRESELMQQYIQEHGQMPGGDDDLDDLF